MGIFSMAPSWQGGSGDVKLTSQTDLGRSRKPYARIYATQGNNWSIGHDEPYIKIFLMHCLAGRRQDGEGLSDCSRHIMDFFACSRIGKR